MCHELYCHEGIYPGNFTRAINLSILASRLGWLFLCEEKSGWPATMQRLHYLGLNHISEKLPVSAAIFSLWKAVHSPSAHQARLIQQFVSEMMRGRQHSETPLATKRSVMGFICGCSSFAHHLRSLLKKGAKCLAWNGASDKAFNKFSGIHHCTNYQAPKFIQSSCGRIWCL